MANYYSTTLQKGSKGDEVKEWQKFLNTQGYNLDVDGVFGGKTYAATTAWQGKNGLDIDGIVGEKTWGKAGFTPYPTGSTSNTTTPSEGWSYGDFNYDDFTYDNYKAPDDFKYDDFTYDKYKESDTVTGAKDALDKHLSNKPGEYQSQWQSQIDNLMNQIMNREKFSYNMNEDALYQQYKDKYIQQGKMAMADTMGQAAAMTGGYGNSYAQSVGQQAYQAHLQNLNDIVPQLYQMALDKYNMEGQDLYNQYGMVVDRENTDYGRYRDTISDYLTERDYLAGRYDSERDYDYSKYVDDRNFSYGQYSDDRNFEYGKWADDRNFSYSTWADDRNFEYGKWADDRAFDYNKYSADRSLAYDKYSSDRNLAYDKYATDKNLSYEEYRNSIEDERWQKEWELTNEQWDWQKSQAGASGSGSGGNGGNGGNGGSTIYNSDGTLKEGYTTTNTSFFDENGNFKQASFSRYDSDGNAVWYIDGKEVVRQPGANPYTGAVNPDAKNGTFSNGYQPDNVNGQKLSKTGITDTINGVTQNIWKTPDGTRWIWDGTQNKYLKYGDPQRSSGGSAIVGGGNLGNVVHTIK